MLLASITAMMVMLSVLVGFLLGVIGIGGGGLYVILPTFVLDIPVKAAVGAALALSSVTAMVGVVGHWRRGK